MQRAHDLPDLLHYEKRLLIVDLASLIDERCQLGGSLHKKPRVHANAMTAHARTRAEDVDARVQVSEPNRLPDVHAKSLSQTGELIRDGDVDVASGVLH